MVEKASPPLRRILLTADTVGGVFTYALSLVEALGALGVEVGLATMGAPLQRDQREALSALPHVTVFESSFRLEWMQDPWEDVAQAGRWLLELEARFRPQLIHLNSYVHGALPWRAPLLIVGHSCVLSWWQAVHGECAPPSWERYRSEVRRGLRKAAKIVAPSTAMLAALKRHYDPLPPGEVIFNGSDAARFSPGKKEPFILSLGRLWDEAKNLRVLDQVAPDLPWPVYVAGETAHPDGTRATPQYVTPLGRLHFQEVASYLARASIYVLPAKYEPFGLSILEAALSGCALVLGDIPSLREIWEGAALFVPPHSPEALREALLGLIGSESVREELAARARLRALGLTSRRMAEGYLRVYQDLSRSAVCAS